MRCDAIIHDTNISHRINCFILLEVRWTIGRAVIRTSGHTYNTHLENLNKRLSKIMPSQMKVLNSALGVADTPTTHI